MERVLFTASLASHIRAFHLPYLQLLQRNGYEVWVAANDDIGETLPFCDQQVQIDFARSPFTAQSGRALKQLRDLLGKKEFRLVHTHTPTAAALTRIASTRARGKGAKVVYTAHGFHFYQGAPMLNWGLWYPVEKSLAHLTDAIITINEEDFALATAKFPCRVYHTHGIGVDLNAFAPGSGVPRSPLGIPETAPLLLSVGELNENKNHELVIRALPNLPGTHYMIAGKGDRRGYLEGLATDLGVRDRVHLLGFVRDIVTLNNSADVFVFPSKREGFPVSPLEALACGVPVVGNDVRGLREQIVPGSNGFLFDGTVAGCTGAIRRAITELLPSNGLKERCRASVEAYSVNRTVTEVAGIYSAVLGEKLR